MRLGLDFHLLMTLLSRSWFILAGAVTVLLLPQGLDPQQQGYYYTFASLLTLQVFFELGLGQIIIQLVSHEAAHLQYRGDGRWEGPALHRARLATLARLMRRWYAWAALAFTVVAGGGGWLFFSLYSDSPTVLWGGPWLVLVGGSALNLMCSPGLAMREGLGQVGQVARLRLLQAMLGYGLFWTALEVGAGLWSAPVVPLVSALVTWCWLSRQPRLGQPDANDDALVRWRTDVFPLQWRMAVSWISGFFIVNLFTPLTFSVWGAQEAGRLGMALAVYGSITTVGMSWVNAKFPVMGRHIARGERRELNHLFRHVLRNALVVNALGSAVFLILVWWLTAHGVAWIERLAGLAVLAVLALVTLVNTAVFAMATYMRAHREEPMLAVSIVMGGAVGLSAYASVGYGVLPMMLLYLMLNSLVNLPWTTWLWRHYVRHT